MIPVKSNLQCERSRVLGTLDFAENSILNLKLPLDTVLKGLYIRLSGAVQTTFGSGTPVAKAEGTMDSLVNRIDVTVNGGETIKALRPHFLHMQALFATGVQGERFSSAAAAAATDNFPTTPGTFAFGTTTQYSTVRETVYLPFEMIHAEPGMGRESTYLNLKRCNSAELKIFTSSFANLLGFGNTAPVVFGNHTLKFEIVSVERQDVGEEAIFDYWKQIQRTIPISSESRDLSIDLNMGNYVTGFLFFVKDGAAGSSTTATGKLASNLAVTNVELKQNGTTTVQRSSFKALQAKNRLVNGVNADFSAGVSRLDGVAHMNLLSRKDLGTALPAMRPVTDNLQLLFDSNTASNVSYTNPVEVSIVQEELVRLAPRQTA